jgi:hypothetical protein
MKMNATTFSWIVVSSPIQAIYNYCRRHLFQGLLAPSRWARPVVSALRNTSTSPILVSTERTVRQNVGVVAQLVKKFTMLVRTC